MKGDFQVVMEAAKAELMNFVGKDTVQSFMERYTMSTTIKLEGVFQVSKLPKRYQIEYPFSSKKERKRKEKIEVLLFGDFSFGKNG